MFLLEKFGKIFERISSHHWSDMSNIPWKVRINKINIVRVLFLLSMPKKVKEILRTSLIGSKITWTETFVRSKKFAKSKATLNWGTLACYEDLPIKPTLKNVQSFLCVTVISQFSSLHCLSSNNSENTNHRHLLWTRTDRSNSRLFWKYSLLEKQPLISEL